MKVAFDTIRIANAYLNMIVFPKSSRGIQFGAFPEYTSNRIKFRRFYFLIVCMQELNYSTIQLAYENFAGRTRRKIFRQWKPGLVPD